MSVTPSAVSTEINDALLKHIDSKFWMRDPQLRAELRDLLTNEYALLGDPLIEPVLAYQFTQPALEIAQSIGLSDRNARILVESVFDQDNAESVGLGLHQQEALEIASRDENPRNPIVTT